MIITTYSTIRARWWMYKRVNTELRAASGTAGRGLWLKRCFVYPTDLNPTRLPPMQITTMKKLKFAHLLEPEETILFVHFTVRRHMAIDALGLPAAMYVPSNPGKPFAIFRSRIHRVVLHIALYIFSGSEYFYRWQRRWKANPECPSSSR